MARAAANDLGIITNLEKMAAFSKSFVQRPVYGKKVASNLDSKKSARDVKEHTNRIVQGTKFPVLWYGLCPLCC